DAVELHVLEAEVRIGRPPDTLLAVVVQPDRGHLVDAVVLPGHQLGAAGADAADQTERRPVLAGPVRTVRAVDDERHALAQRRRGVGREQVVRNPRHVDVAVGGDPRILHRALLSRMLRPHPTTGPIAPGHHRPGSWCRGYSWPCPAPRTR